jgi:hypothetical protein
LRKVFVDELPRRTGKTQKIDWVQTGMIKPTVKFLYDEIKGEVKIVNYEKRGQKLTVEYKNTQFTMRTGEFLKCAFGSLVNKLNKTVIQGINDIYSQEPWMLKFFVNPKEAKNFTKGLHVKIKVICPICNTVKDKEVSIFNLYKYKSIGCLKCGDGISYPNKFCFNLLRQLGVKFMSEYTPEWLDNNMRYDFFIPSLNIIIEMDGLFHDLSEDVKNSDEYKNNKAIDNNVEMIRIDCRKSNLEYIKVNILNSRLSQIFDLSFIDWLQIEKFCLSSMVKEVCSLWDSGIQSTNVIIDITGLCKSTICKYLNQGAKLGWCSYNGKKEKIKTWKKIGLQTAQKIGKKVEIFKDGKSLGIFDNCMELERKSEELFGVKLSNKHISGVCNGRRKSHKGFTYKHV